MAASLRGVSERELSQSAAGRGDGPPRRRRRLTSTPCDRAARGPARAPRGLHRDRRDVAASRVSRAREEALITVSAADVRDFQVRSAPDGTVLIFGIGPHLAAKDLPPFHPNEETAERSGCRGAYRSRVLPSHSRARGVLRRSSALTRGNAGRPHNREAQATRFRAALARSSSAHSIGENCHPAHRGRK